MSSSDSGVDIVVASGFETGGHRPSFLRSPERSLTGLFSLLPRLRDAVEIPVIAAGGIAEGTGGRRGAGARRRWRADRHGVSGVRRVQRSSRSS
jgi:hypothetical protein